MLHVHRADRADALVAALGDLLAVPPADPFAAEVIGVPTRGVERWLTQSLSSTVGAASGRSDGIVANVAFPSPREIVDAAVAAACGVDVDADPWAPARVVWPLLEVVDAHLDDAWLAILADHLRDSAAVHDGAVRPRRLSAVRHLATLLGRYALHRPEMLRAWQRGEDVDGSGRPLGAHNSWQAELWRRLRERIAAPGPAERQTDAVARLMADPSLAELPARLGLFGLTRLPAAHVEVLRALASGRDVHLFALHPSPALWSRVAGLGRSPSRRRAEDPTAELAQNRLLASWGRDVRELQLVLGAPAVDHPHETASQDEPGTLLARLQADIRADRAAPGAPVPGELDARPPLGAGDQSVAAHACHGRARQVEVLRDALLHVLQSDDTLEPRDVIVMCPDIEAFAPLIHATFGVGDTLEPEDADGGSEAVGVPDLRVRLADRALRQTNPVLGAIARILELADQRLTASQVLDLADRAPVRRRFGLDDDSLARIEDWVVAGEIRWGLDAAHRAPFKLDAVAANTWRAGLDRVLLGVAMTEDALPLVGGVLPLDDVGSGAIDLAGRFAELLERIRVTVERFAQPMTIAEWAAALAAAADLLTATTPRDAWQRAQLDRLLAGLVENAGTADHASLELAEVRELLDEQLRGRPTRANFRTGHLTFCTLNPMRSVPHRVVCLLGLDDTVFPRKAPRDGDDLIFDDPHVGDHDGRTEDRQMVLDALMAAQERLIVTFTGNDERTNAPRPPAVPVGELLDAIDRTVGVPSGRPRDAVLTHHPLQPFDPRNFTPGELTAGQPFSFDRVTLAGARALVAPRSARPPFLTGRLAPLDTPLLALEDVVRFVQHPARAFLRDRLGVTLSTASEDLADALPIDLDHLEQWGVGQRLLDAALAGHDLDAAVAAERARGSLPPGALADPTLTEVRNRAAAVAHAVTTLLGPAGAVGSVDVRVPLAAGRTLSGTVAGLDADVLRTVSYSRVGPKHRLAAWVRLLALTATWPERPLEAVTVGRVRSGGSRDATVTVTRIGPLGGADADPAARRAAALTQLRVILDLYDRGMREPPPLACATSAAYAHATRANRNATTAASSAWTSKWKFPKEDQELEHQQLLGGVVAFDRLLEEAARSDELGDGWDAAQPSRFGRWALRLWSGLCAVEQVSDR
ncbi:MAG: exodeoxyribonuclease V subunit gamma [Solirubrobacteraceae bacterium]